MNMLAFAIIILISYIVVCVSMWGIPDSISQTWFSIRHRWIFSAVMVTGFCLLFLPMVEVLPLDWECLAFITSSGGILIGFAPNLKDDLEEKVHMTGATLLGVGSQSIVGMLMPWLLMAWVAWIPFAFGKKRVFWAEVIGGLTLIVSIVWDIL